MLEQLRNPEWLKQKYLEEQLSTSHGQPCDAQCFELGKVKEEK